MSLCGMVSKMQVSLVDDLDGSEPASTHTLELDGKRVQIDLSAANFDALRAALQPYLAAGRRAGASRSVRVPTDPAQSRAIRAWARANGIGLSDRGAIPHQVRAAYDAAAGR